MNKRFFQMPLAGMMLTAVAVMSSCGDDEQPQQPPESSDKTAVVLTADIADMTPQSPQIRPLVVNDQWESADRIGLYMKRAGQTISTAGAVLSGASNVQMSLSGNNLTSTPALYYPETGNVDFVAYYPYTASVGADCTVPVNVAGQAAALPVEYLYSNNATNKAPSATAVPLTFRYSLAKLSVTVTAGAGSTLSASDFAAMTVSVEGFYTAARLNLSSGAFTAPEGYQAITLHKTGSTATAATFDALILPATITTGEVVFVFNVGGKSYRYEAAGSYSAATNYAMTFTLDNLTPNLTATLLSATITPRTTASRNFTVNTGTSGVYTVAVTTGQLQAQLNTLTENNPDAVKGLILTGTLNAADVTTLAALAYLEDLDLSGVNFPGNRLTNEAFKGKTVLKHVVLPASITAIGNDAFSGCTNLTGALAIPANVTNVESGAFNGCSKLTDLTLGANVKAIGIDAFRYCGFKGNLILPAGLESIGNYAFYNCKFTGGLSIPNSVTSIGTSAFSGCSGFTGNLTISNSVTSIGIYAFHGCSGFSGNLTIPNGVTSIGASAFDGCSGFTGNLTIPNGVTSIGGTAFRGCSGFTGLTLGSGLKTIEGGGAGGGAFQNCSGFTGNLTIPNSVTSIGSDAFANCGFDGTLTLPANASFAHIDYRVFSGCKHFTGALVIPNSVKTITPRAFYECWSFSSLSLGTGVTTIQTLAFGSCSGLQGTISISGINSVASDAFEGCTGLTFN